MNVLKQKNFEFCVTYFKVNNMNSWIVKIILRRDFWLDDKFYLI